MRLRESKGFFSIRKMGFTNFFGIFYVVFYGKCAVALELFPPLMYNLITEGSNLRHRSWGAGECGHKPIYHNMAMAISCTYGQARYRRRH